MSINTSVNCFKKNGRSLKLSGTAVNTGNYKAQTEVISSLFDVNVEQKLPRTDSKFKFASKFTTFVNSNRYSTAGVMCSMLLSFGIFAHAAIVPTRAQPLHSDKYSIYASKPLVMEQSTSTVHTKDSRAQKIDAVYKKYSCPMEGLGETFVNEADKANIPWWLVASVAFKESTCGKKMPIVNGVNSFNAWGWGVYGSNIASFDNWARGIETVSKYFGDKFYSKGVTEACDIMKIYTPSSPNGVWCQDVKAFGQEIQNYQTPND